MASIKISALPTAGAIFGSELVPVVQSGNTVHATVSQILASALAAAAAASASAATKVASVSAIGPLSSSGGTTPVISLTGVLAAANGGTGLATPGPSGQVLTSNGTGWVSSAFSAGTADFVLQSYGLV